MWPYNDEEAVWLTPPERAQPVRGGSANDNDAARRLPPRSVPSPVPQSAPKK